MPAEVVNMESKAKVKSGLKELDSDLEDGLVTEKGYWKKKLRLLNPVISSNDLDKIKELESDLKEDLITEAGYYVKISKLLSKVVSDMSEDINGAQEQATENGGESKVKKEVNGNNEHATNGNSLKDSDDQTDKTGNGHIAKDAPSSGGEEQMEVCDVKEAPDSPPPKPAGSKKQRSAKKVETEAVVKNTRSEKKAATGQRSITSMFSKKPAEPKRKGDTEIEADTQPEKRIKLEDEEATPSPTDVVEDKPIVKVVPPKKSRDRCIQCRQYYDDPDLQVFNVKSFSDALEEMIMLCDDRLQLCTEDVEYLSDDRPQHKITCFSIFDTMNHLCRFDTGLIEQNKQLYFSGYVKPIYDDNPKIEGGIKTHQMGPINEWWTCGFDGGEQALIGFSTAVAEYILMEPSPEYKPMLSAVKEKIYMSKLVIEFLTDYPEATYEDLLNSLSATKPPPGIVSYTEDSLLRHAQWIVDQVESYDETADEDEQMLVLTPCMRDLIKLSGVTLGQRRKAVKGIKVKKIKKELPSFTMATTTPLVQSIFDSLFKGQINENAAPAKRRQRCGTCERCQAPDCGQCSHCRDKVKFGGSGRLKQACVLTRCTNIAVAEANADDILDDNQELELKAPKAKKIVEHSFKKVKNNLQWSGSVMRKDGDKSYYFNINLNDQMISMGDYVSVKPDDTSIPVYLGQIMFMYEDTRTKEKNAHFHWFKRANETLLGEASDPQELFVVDECETTLLNFVIGKIKVVRKFPSDNWVLDGGREDPDNDRVVAEDDDNAFFYQLSYDENQGRFEDIVQEAETGLNHCPSCIRKTRKILMETPILEEKLNTSSGHDYYGVLKFDDNVYRLGNTVFLNPDTIEYHVRPKPQPKKTKSKKSWDEENYPEKYRKTEYVKGNNDASPDPFQVCRIVKMYAKQGRTPKEPNQVKVVVAAFYRAENTNLDDTFKAPLNLLYWSDETTTILLSDVIGLCPVVFVKDMKPETLCQEIKHNGAAFYFKEAYNAEEDKYVKVPEHVSSGVKSNDDESDDCPWRPIPVEEDDESLEKLRCLDVFAGCGGLSEGFHQAGIAESRWAIEKEEPAALAYKLNNPNAHVFTDDCNNLLLNVMQGKKQNISGQPLPQKGEVDMLCGGPPCQGFSGMNRFNHREYSKFKNSLISSYLSYCDYYRPRFFLLENVRNFVSFKRGMVLKLALRCLVRMGYQCTFGVLQAGCYGVPQTRRRAIILAAAPGEKLPHYPEPLHTFSPRAIQLTVQIDDLRFESCIKNTHSAPFRTITVRDALSDLPAIDNGCQELEMTYTQKPQSTFQGLMRLKKEEKRKKLRDHICKDMNPLVHKRMTYIPLEPGSDWRDLPNTEARLSDGTMCKKLIYGHHDKKNGRSSTGGLRGVCQCVQGKGCDASDRQHNTLIPWCLPHTANRHNNWAGLYGRIQWDGFFSTTITNPEPMGKQGRVLHPEQHRVVSVRECARSQGFPDHYQFYGSVTDKHRQVGNAVPPPMAREIGREIKKCVKWRAARDKERDDETE